MTLFWHPKRLTQYGEVNLRKSYSQFVFVVDVSFLKTFRQELLRAVGAGVDQVVVGGMSLREMAPDVSHRTPTFLKNHSFLANLHYTCVFLIAN